MLSAMHHCLFVNNNYYALYFNIISLPWIQRFLQFLGARCPCMAGVGVVHSTQPRRLEEQTPSFFLLFLTEQVAK